MRRRNLPGSGRSTRRVAAAALVLLLGLYHLHACRAEEQGKHMSTHFPTLEELEKLPPDGGSNYNRLVFEKSPYLLQHAANPVNWYPWGDEAFEQAKATGKPVFLSIGYSTCHWCHVMERESFEDPEVARLMNQAFVSIKVDREERPDIDNVYMAVCQAMTGRGGWPLTIIMTPERKPFFAGTYYPKNGRFGRPGMMELIPQIAQAWREQRGEILTSAEKIITHVQSLGRDASGTEPGVETLESGYSQLASRFDAARGGFGSEPKFPTPHNLSFLLRHWKRTGDARALAMVEKTLQAMRDGGLYDHIGYGFHRYSTDSDWLVPHFEKMLYDQAMLTIAYVEAYQATGKEEYAQTVREIITYVLRDMTSPEGGFYSAEDADSEGIEGKFYLWPREEIVAILGQPEGELYCRVFNIKPGGNFQNPHTPPGTNIPHRTKAPADLAKELGIEEHTLGTQLDTIRQKLFNAREKRIHPYKDDKILTDWNGLMIAAMAKAGQALDEPRYIAAAQRAADFLLTKLRDKKGRLLKRYRQGEAGLPAHLDDYAFVVWGLLDLYEACFDVRYLDAAIELNHQMLAGFWDNVAGGLFFTANDGEALPMRTKDAYDGAIPSGNSVAMLNLLRLGRITANANLEQQAASIGRTFSNSINQSPSAHTQMLCSLDFGIGPSREIIIVGKSGAEDTQRLLQIVRPRFIPNKVVLFRPSTLETPPITRIARFTAAYKSLNGKATAYVCTDYTCQAPTTTPDKLRSLLSRKVATD